MHLSITINEVNLVPVTPELLLLSKNANKNYKEHLKEKMKQKEEQKKLDDEEKRLLKRKNWKWKR